MASSSKDSGYVDNWQAGKTVTECNLHMLTTEDCSDVIFRVGSEKHVVRAHRYVLVSRSCVFHAMFCGPLAETGEITIPDIEPHVFREFLRYLYTDTASITAENVTGLLYTSRKYAIDLLLNQCTTFLEKSLSEENVCQILEQCHGYGELDLEQKALTLLTNAGESVIKSKGFHDLCSNCLGKFLKSCHLNLKEEQVYKAALSWSTEKCRQENLSPSPENIRKCLGDLRYEIRFTEFSLDYLVNDVGPSGILTRDERMDIMDRSFNSDVDITPFKSSQRKKNPGVKQRSNTSLFHSVQRFARCISGFKGLSCTGQEKTIAFSSNRDIQLGGCQLYGPAFTTESTYRLSVYLYIGYECIAQPVSNIEINLKGQGEVNDVMFPDPISLQAGQFYDIYVHMTGECTNYGEDGKTTVSTDGVIFTFTKSNYERGQIPGLLWR